MTRKRKQFIVTLPDDLREKLKKLAQREGNSEVAVIRHLVAIGLAAEAPGEMMAEACGMEYLRALPAVVPAGRWLVHNHVRPTRRLGSRGFRAWLSAPGTAKLEVCDCDWAPELGRHFRVKRLEQLLSGDSKAAAVNLDDTVDNREWLKKGKRAKRQGGKP